MDSRRNFIGRVASGIAGTLAVPSAVLGANDRIRLGIIGAGARGMEIVREAMSCPNTEFVAFADIYTRRLEEAKRVAPNAKTYLNYKDLLDNKSIDAVLIATPQHLHCEHFVASLDAGKHVYQEKTMAFTVDHAKENARRLQARRKTHSADWASVLFHGPDDRCTAVPVQQGLDGEGHGDSRTYVPQHAARETTVVAPRLS